MLNNNNKRKSLSKKDFLKVTDKLIKKQLEATPKVLDFTEKRIGDEGVKVIHQYLTTNKTQVTTLELFGNEITDESIKQLVGFLQFLGQIKIVKLEFNYITNDGINEFSKFLVNNNTITKLDLYANRISDDGCTGLANIIEKNTTLQELLLHSNQIGNKGALLLIKALEKNYTLKKLIVANNLIDEELDEIITCLIDRNVEDNKEAEIPAIPKKFLTSTTEAKKEKLQSLIKKDKIVDEKKELISNQSDFKEINIDGITEKDELIENLKIYYELAKKLNERNIVLENFVSLVQKNLPN
jgi:Ran GTPase-activating protein (RanGAP) involved in mRNA processing and transport